MAVPSLVRFVLDGHTEEEDLMNLFHELFNSGDIKLSDLNLVSLLNIVKKEQDGRLPDPEKGRMPIGVVDPKTGEKNKRAPPHESWMTIDLAEHYLRFAAAIYGSSYIYALKDSAGFFQWIFNMARNSVTKPSNRASDEKAENLEIIKNLTDLKDEDLVYLTYENDMEKKPFMISLDHKHKAILVSIRGTISKIDWITDFKLAPTMSVIVDGSGVKDMFVHGGILKVALYLKGRLEGEYNPDQGSDIKSDQTGLLTKALHQLENSVDENGQKVGKDGAKAYRLVITGHSLGAGVAAVLAILMKTEYPDLRCFAYSPPGCLMSESAADYCSPFVLSVILGDDLVGRFGVYTALNLKITVFKTLREHPEIFLFGFFNDKEKIKEQNALIDKVISQTETEVKDAVRLFLPGSVMYIEEKQKASLFGKRTYSQHFCSRRDGIFSEILLSEYIVSHHLPWRLQAGLKYIKSQPIADK